VSQAVAAGTADVRNATDMYAHCEKEMSVVAKAEGVCCHKTREFFLLEDVTRKTESKELSTVVGSRSLHHVGALGPGLLAARELSCFCDGSQSGDFLTCEAPEYISRWKTVKIYQHFTAI
jgi:hypothetical protein